jgi:hypothetical protein
MGPVPTEESPLATDEFFWRDRNCKHRWIIEPANGPTSMGRCRHCGAEREFINNPDAVIIQP